MEHRTHDLIRLIPTVAARAAVDGTGNTMSGYPIVFNEWAEIDTLLEGPFRERVMLGAVTKTLKERGNQIQVLFNHGMDPQLGDKPLGVPKVQQEVKLGLWTEVELDQARSVQEEIVPRLRSGSLAGMSFRFDVVKDEWNEARTERTITELKLYEYGPVTFPAYTATTVGIRSLNEYNEFKKEAARTIGAAESVAASTFAERNADLEEVQKWLQAH